MLFPSQLLSSLDKIPTLALLELQKYRNLIDDRLSRVRSNASAIIHGKRKNEVSDWWLARIEHLVNEYLTKNGYDHSALPHDYISQPPTNVKRVIENLKIVESVLKSSTPEIRDFLLRVSREIYEKLNEFISEIRFILENQSIFEKLRIRVDFSSKESDRLHSDLAYLLQMQKMDEEIDSRIQSGQFKVESIRLSDVVPVGGLIMARFHMCECELRTSLDLWGGEEGRAALRSEGEKEEREKTFLFLSFGFHSIISFKNRLIHQIRFLFHSLSYHRRDSGSQSFAIVFRGPSAYSHAYSHLRVTT